MLSLLVCFANTVALGTSLDRTLSAKNRSFAPSLDGKAVIHQLIGQLERAVQQKNWESFAMLVTLDVGTSANALNGSSLRDRFVSLFETYSNSQNGVLRQGHELDFRDLRFRVDSITANAGSTIAYVEGTWANLGAMRNRRNQFQLDISTDNGQCRFRSAEQVLSLVESFAATDAFLYDVSAGAKFHTANETRKISSALDDHDASMLFAPVNWWQNPVVPRITQTVSREKIATGLDLFGCVSSISSYLYIDADDFAADLVAGSDECWRRVVVMDDKQEYLVAKGHHGTGASLDDFAAPRGMEFCGPSRLYVAEDYNNRIKVLSVSTSSNDHVDLFKFVTMSQFNHPQDLDVSPPSQYSYKRTVVVANSGGNNVLAFTDEEPLGHGAVTVHDGVGTHVGAFNHPTSIAFGRNPVTSEKTGYCYFIDSGNRRIVEIGNVFMTPSYGSYLVYDDFPDPRTDLSGIGVDNKGEVWVVDKGLGRIYKFTSNLVPIATHGMTGTADGEYLHPTSISFTEGYEYGVGPIANLGEVVLGEEWGDNTGIRRLVAGTEIFDPHLYYAPRLQDSTPARLFGDYFITGYSNLTETYTAPNGTVNTYTFNMKPSGLEPFNFTLPAGSPSGTYTLKIRAQSIYQNSNTDSVTLSVDVDTSLVNQLPAVTCVYFPGGDTCFTPNVAQQVAAYAWDHEGSVANYFWSCSPASAGHFSNQYTNPTTFTASPHSEKPYVPRLLRVQVTDDFGQLSAYRNVDIDDCPITACICLSCGDANSDGAYDISDAVFLISHIFSNGAAPNTCNYPKGKGDANGDGAVDISDAVYLIARIFIGGLPPHCQGM
jgi:hypothetical protein